MGKYDENEPSKLRQFLAAFIGTLIYKKVIGKFW